MTLVEQYTKHQVSVSDVIEGAPGFAVQIFRTEIVHNHVVVFNILTVQHFIYELLVTILIREESFFQLQQFLRHGVIEDSKQVACLLLSLESAYPPCFELALDMLKVAY